MIVDLGDLTAYYPAMLKEEFLYDLPRDRIALYPSQPRDACRLIVIHRESGRIEHRIFHEIVNYLDEGDCLVLNESKVQPVRFRLRRATGGVVELLFTKRVREGVWVALARPSKRPKIGERLVAEGGEGVVEIKEKKAGKLTLRLLIDESELFRRLGLAPLPGYIHRIPEERDLETYQTVFAREGFSIAAPTAGLHFTGELLKRIQAKGVQVAYIQLDVGEGTFRPVMTERVENHRMEAENYTISPEAAEKINRAKRIIAVGTTVTRTLETFPADEPIPSQSGSTGLFIYPGYKFRQIDVLLTNFHQPGSTPLLLTVAFCGKELLFEAYRQALEMDYRLLSYGDAMLILPHDVASQRRGDPKRER
jgi:S-adenosylmethionine:tRNA ribosyltransferase-isomerase